MDSTPTRSWPLSKGFTTTLLFLGLLLVVTLVWSTYTFLQVQFQPHPAQPNQQVSSGPSASWPNMFQLAYRAASKTDPGVLIPINIGSIVVEAADFQTGISGPTSTLKIRFAFVGPNGDTVLVTMEDASPSSTLKTDVSPDKSGVGLVEYRNAQLDNTEFRRLIASILHSPREALELTWKEAHDYARQHALSNVDALPPTIRLTYRPDQGTAIWALDYSLADNPQHPTRRVDALFAVDAQTGSINSRVFLDDGQTPTPVH